MDNVTSQPGQRGRRQFLKTTVGAGGLLAMPAIVRGRDLNSRVRHASIGVGGMGSGDLDQIGKHPMVDIVALCDVDAGALAAAGNKFPDARRYSDWRQLLEKEAGKIDSVNVATPDHMHAAIGMVAIRAGLALYLQKPMCHDVAEVRALTVAAAKAGVVTQLGTQFASSAGDRTAVQWARSGLVGRVERVFCGSNRGGAVPTYRLPGPRPAEPASPPDNLSWDLWLGTAPARPYAPKVYHPTLWRSWQDFGTGWSGDIGCHILDAIWRSLDLKAPVAVKAEVEAEWAADPARRADTWPRADLITWTFPGNPRIVGPTLDIQWCDGAYLPPEPLRGLWPDGAFPEEFAAWVGEKGTLVLQHTGMPKLFVDGKVQQPERPQLEPRNHYHHFIDAVLGRAKNESGFDHAGPMSETVLLGTVAIRCPGETLRWDSPALAISGSAAAPGLLRRTYRDGWRVEGLG